MKPRDVADEIVDTLLDDIASRFYLEKAWRKMEPEEKRDIREKWARLIRRKLEEYGC